MKRVLIICYYWPPAGGPGVQRWLKFVKYFRDFNIEPIVFVPEGANYPITDDSLSSQVPQGVEIIKRPIKEPYRFARWFSKRKTQTLSSGTLTEKKPSWLERMLLYIRGNYFIPDARKNWVDPSVKYLLKYLKDQGIDTVVTTGPPHSLHLIGLQLKKTLDIKWLADFRDPWTTIHYHKSLRLSKSSREKHKRLEQEVLKGADHIVVTSPTTLEEFKAITTKPVDVITNGFDDEVGSNSKLDNHFSLVHVGTLLSNRNPEALWSVLAELCKEHEDIAKSLRIRLVGKVGKEVLETLHDLGLGTNLEISGYVSHDAAIQAQQSAQLLLLIEMNKPETRAIIPGKLFEYLRARRPIIAIGPHGSDIEPILKETGAGEFFTYSERQELKQEILQCFDLFSTGTLKVTSSGVQKYHRRNLTGRMAALIRSLNP
ncbi:MAG: glycosyltransferase family 4 protein [Flavobacteriaceae bacterium]|nr:glycosyltransferase family 4 protein [Flavobacteriaceae bacterium]